jgi:thymidylate kinase
MREKVYKSKQNVCNKKALIVGFEGPCLAGKTTTIRSLYERFTKRGLLVLYLREFTEMAGGHGHLPPVIPQTNSAARASASFFINLEQLRRYNLCQWLANIAKGSNSIVLVDRLLFTCMGIRKAIKDYIGYQLILRAAKQGKAIIPDSTIFLELPKSKEEVQRRLACRDKFENSDLLYDPAGYDDFFRYVDRELFALNLTFSNEEKIQEIEKLILRMLY